MRVVSVPLSLRVATSMLALSVPLVALELIIHARQPWWNLPYTSLQGWGVGVGIVCALLAYWTLAMKRWALPLMASIAVIWCCVSLTLTIRSENIALGFFTLFISMFWIGVYFWLDRELDRSFLNSRKTWYQGLPEPIAGLLCDVPSAAQHLRVSRIDQDGAFVFSKYADKIENLGQVTELVFNYRNRQIRCMGKPVSILDGEVGFGFQFQHVSVDAKKNLGDFIEVLRGEGHVP